MTDHDQWQERLPFYVARTLPPDERHRFEQHLAHCEQCQQELRLWQQLASAVWHDADEVARQLPPLSPTVYQRLSYRDQTPRHRYSSNPPTSPQPIMTASQRTPPRSAASRIPWTLVAAMLIMVCIGGLWTFSALLPRPTNETGVVILASPQAPDMSAASITLGPFITITPNLYDNGTAYCEAFNPTEADIVLREQANQQAPSVGRIVPGAISRVFSVSADGWYFLQGSQGGRGWLAPDIAYLRGNCTNNLPIATATSSATP